MFRDVEGYPVWVTDLADKCHGIRLFVFDGLDPETVLRGVGAPAAEIRSVRIPDGAPEAAWSSRAMAAVGVDFCRSVALSAAVGRWTVLYETGDAVLDYTAIDLLSSDVPRAASCSVNGALDSDLTYAEDGRPPFWITEPISACRPEELPHGLRAAAEIAGVTWHSDEAHAAADHTWDPAENFRVVCALADLRLNLQDLRSRRVLGVSFG